MSSLPGSPSPHTPARFFGFDLGFLWRDLLTAWRGMLDWPIFSWAWPKLAVCLYLPTGASAFCRGLNTSPLHDEQRAKAARLQAVLLPEDLLLRRTLELPQLQPTELQAALTLEAQALSPFAPSDIIWAHEIAPSDSAVLRVQLVLTSRKLIEQHIETFHPQLKALTPEVWAPRVNGSGFVMLPGFGEARRQRQSTGWRWASASLGVLVLTLIGAMAITPSVQLYLRAMQAKQAMAALQKKAGPVMAQRESLVHATDQLANLGELRGKPVPPLQILKLITEALPDDTSLLTLQIEGFKVNISGQTANASALMKQLGSTPGLRDVKAPTPAIKPLGAPRESFTIEFTFDPAQVRPTP